MAGRRSVGTARWPGKAWWGKSLRGNLKGIVTGQRAGTGLEGAECAQRLEALWPEQRMKGVGGWGQAWGHLRWLQ